MPYERNLQLEGEDAQLSWREVRHYLEAPRRRPVLILTSWVAVFLLSVAAFFILPKKYQSSALILVESEKVPESFVAKVATEEISQRLWSIQPEILSRTRLEKVLDETRPYPEIKSKTEAVEEMRRAVSIEVSGQEGFTLSFIHKDPSKAQAVTARIATLFIDETMRAREEQVGGAVDFLETQVAEARKGLDTKDEALRRYKERRMGTLPQQLQTNLATMSMIQRELQSVDENLFFAREKHEALSRNVARSGAGPSADPAGPEATELIELRRQLASLRARRYTDEHPDVESLRSRIARLDAQDSSVGPAEGSATESSDSVNRQQLERVSLEIRNLEEKRAGLERRLASVRANVEETPRTEQELSTLTRDYEELNENYTSLLSKQLEAQMAGRLEQRWKGARFRILDPASLPEKPFSPNPWVVLGLGAVLGLCVGLGATLGAEFLDRTVKDAEDSEAFQGHPVLASIPHHPGLGGS